MSLAHTSPMLFVLISTFDTFSSGRALSRFIGTDAVIWSSLISKKRNVHQTSDWRTLGANKKSYSLQIQWREQKAALIGGLDRARIEWWLDELMTKCSSVACNLTTLPLVYFQVRVHCPLQIVVVCRLHVNILSATYRPYFPFSWNCSWTAHLHNGISI